LWTLVGPLDATDAELDTACRAASRLGNEAESRRRWPARCDLLSQSYAPAARTRVVPPWGTSRLTLSSLRRVRSLESGRARAQLVLPIVAVDLVEQGVQVLKRPGAVAARPGPVYGLIGLGSGPAGRRATVAELRPGRHGTRYARAIRKGLGAVAKGHERSTRSALIWRPCVTPGPTSAWRCFASRRSTGAA